MGISARDVARAAAFKKRSGDVEPGGTYGKDPNGRTTYTNPSHTWDLPFGLGKRRWEPDTFVQNSRGNYNNSNMLPWMQNVVSGQATPNPDVIADIMRQKKIPRRKPTSGGPESARKPGNTPKTQKDRKEFPRRGGDIRA